MTNQRKAYIYALITVACWATVASAFKISLQYLDPVNLLLYSSLTSCLVLFILILLQRKLPLVTQSTRAEYGRSALLGLLNPFLYYLVLFQAYLLLPAQEAQPINQIWAIVLSLLSIVLLHQKIRAINVLAIFISFLGVVVISTHGNLVNLTFSDPVGVGLALGSALIWALYWIYNLKDARDEIVKLFLNFLFGSLYILALTGLTFTIRVPNVTGLLGAIYVGLFEMGLAFVVWLLALKLSRTTVQVSNLIYLVPFLSLIVIYFTIGEVILPSTIIGLILIIAGIVVQQNVKRLDFKKN